MSLEAPLPALGPLRRRGVPVGQAPAAVGLVLAQQEAGRLPGLVVGQHVEAGHVDLVHGHPPPLLLATGAGRALGFDVELLDEAVPGQLAQVVARRAGRLTELLGQAGRAGPLVQLQDAQDLHPHRVGQGLQRLLVHLQASYAAYRKDKLANDSLQINPAERPCPPTTVPSTPRARYVSPPAWTAVSRDGRGTAGQSRLGPSRRWSVSRDAITSEVEGQDEGPAERQRPGPARADGIREVNDDGREHSARWARCGRGKTGERDSSPLSYHQGHSRFADNAHYVNRAISRPSSAVSGCTPHEAPREAGAMRTLTFGMNVSLDGYITAPGEDLGWSTPSDELFQWWSDRVGATGLALYGRKLWDTMSSHWPTADQQPGATPAQIQFAHRWRDMPKIVFSSTTRAVDGSVRLVTGDAVAEIERLKAEDGGPMDIGGATLAAAAVRAGLIDEYALVTHPVLVGGGTPFFTAVDNWVNLDLVETRTFPDGVLLTRYATRR